MSSILPKNDLKILISALAYWGRNLAFVFFEELKKPKRHFKINWLLEIVKKCQNQSTMMADHSIRTKSFFFEKIVHFDLSSTFFFTFSQYDYKPNYWFNQHRLWKPPNRKFCALCEMILWLLWRQESLHACAFKIHINIISDSRA